MREILFRGKRIDNGEWVYGDFGQISSDEGTYAMIFARNYEEFSAGLVDPATIAQYTGQNDKNGVKIFEADIVYAETLNTKGRYQVKFEFGQFCVGINMPVAYVRDSCEVIGNIHDNPDLLTCHDNG